MFKKCISLTKAPELPATELKELCYYGMFENCTHLIEPPKKLLINKFAKDCCKYMFKNCLSLTDGPILSSADETQSLSYYQMFNGCDSLSDSYKEYLNNKNYYNNIIF